MLTILISLFLISIHVLVFFRSNEMILKSYVFINFIFFSSQGLFIGLFGFSHPKFDPQNIDFVNLTLLYTIIFEIILIGSFYLFKSKIGKERVSINLNFNTSSTKVNLLFFSIIMIIILISEFILINANVFFSNSHFIKCAELDIFKYIMDLKINKNFLQMIKLTADFKYYILLFSGFVYMSSKQNIHKNIFYIILFFCILMGLIKGQRSIILISVIIYCIVNFENIKNYYFKKPFFAATYFLIAGTFLIMVARFISHLRNFFFYRGNTDSCEMITGQLGRELLSHEVSLSKSFFLIDFYLTRLNYLIPVSKITEYVDKVGSLNGVQYLANFIGLIPRFLWEGKPIITNDMSFYAYKSGLIKSPDFSVGLRPIGESFLNLGWYGILIAILIGFLFYFLNLFKKNKNIFVKTVYIYLVIHILKSDAYFAIFPGILHVLIGWLIFYLIYYFCLLLFDKKTNMS